jgi:hypothetical protein
MEDHHFSYIKILTKENVDSLCPNEAKSTFDPPCFIVSLNGQVFNI